MKKESISNIYNCCYLLNYEFIKKELEKYLNGYNLKDTFKLIDSYMCSFTNKYNNDLFMNISNDLIKLTELKPNFAQEIIIQGKQSTSNMSLMKFFSNLENYDNNINDDIIIKIRKIEKRTKGIIVTDIYKTYSLCDEIKKEYIISEIREKQYILTKDKLEKNLGNFDFDKINARDISSRLRTYEKFNSIQNLSDYTTYLLINISTRKGITNLFKNDNKQSIQVTLNGVNISNFYSLIDGDNKIPRIYDLYNGIISPENEKDIDNIRNRLLNNKCFDLKTLKGITFQIDNLTGEKINISSEYLKYLKSLFNNKYDYNGNIILTRDELLKIILTKPIKTNKNPVLIKKLS